MLNEVGVPAAGYRLRFSREPLYVGVVLAAARAEAGAFHVTGAKPQWRANGRRVHGLDRAEQTTTWH